MANRRDGDCAGMVLRPGGLLAITVRAGVRLSGAGVMWDGRASAPPGHSYAEAGKPDKALPQLRYYVLNAAPLATQNADEAAKVMESRFVIGQLLASTGEIESAITELQAVRPLFAAAYGPESAQVRNLDKQATRLQSASRT